MSDNNNRLSRSNSRRSFLKKTGAASIVSSALFTQAVAGDEGTWSPVSRSNNFSVTSQSEGVPDAVFSDTYNGQYGSNGQLACKISNPDWTTTSQKDWWTVFPKFGSNVIAYDDNDNPTDHVTYTQHDTSWGSGTSTAPFVCNADDHEEFIGKYYGQYVQSDDYGFAESALESGFNYFLGVLLSSVNPTYSATTLVADIFLDFARAALEDGNNYNREWDWSRKQQASWYTRYNVHAYENETVELDTAEAIAFFGDNNALFSGVLQTYEAPSSSPGIESFSNLSTSQYSYDTALQKDGSEIRAHSGKAVKENPSGFSLTESEIKNLDDDDTVYTAPTRPKVSPTRKTPEDLNS